MKIAFLTEVIILMLPSFEIWYLTQSPELKSAGDL